MWIFSQYTGFTTTMKLKIQKPPLSLQSGKHQFLVSTSHRQYIKYSNKPPSLILLIRQPFLTIVTAITQFNLQQTSIFNNTYVTLILQDASHAYISGYSLKLTIWDCIMLTFSCYATKNKFSHPNQASSCSHCGRMEICSVAILSSPWVQQLHLIQSPNLAGTP